jgi:hypothetical protein
MLRNMNHSDKINISGIALTVGIGVIAILIAYATYRLQQLLYRRNSTPVFELEAQPLTSDTELEHVRQGSERSTTLVPDSSAPLSSTESPSSTRAEVT